MPTYSVQKPPTAIKTKRFPRLAVRTSDYMWGRRFRLPNHYVLPQKAPALASRYHRGKLLVGYLAFGWLHPAASTTTVTHWRAWIRRPGLPDLLGTRLLSARFGGRMPESRVWWLRLSGMARAEGSLIRSEPG